MHARFAGSRAFTLVELLVVIALIALLATVLLPALAGAKIKGQAISCLNNERQLALACMMYVEDAADAFPYNLGSTEIKRRAAEQEYINWTTPVMSWEKDDTDNTNTVLLTRGGLGPYVARASQLYRCPADHVLDPSQAALGWSFRVRSISMNAMVGNAGEFSTNGENTNNPDYRQFFRMAQMPKPSQIFVFIEEHPDSINDGYFLDQPNVSQWHDLPASYHNGAVNLTYGDGHAGSYKWKLGSTTPPARPDAAHLPIALAPDERTDFRWLMSRMTLFEY